METIHVTCPMAASKMCQGHHAADIARGISPRLADAAFGRQSLFEQRSAHEFLAIRLTMAATLIDLRRPLEQDLKLRSPHRTKIPIPFSFFATPPRIFWRQP